jgi:hypothetical protein
LTGKAARFERGKIMCLTNTVDVIDFGKLDEPKKEKLRAMKAKLEARRQSLQQRIADLDEGLIKLNQALK